MELIRDFLTANLDDKGSCTRGLLHLYRFRDIAGYLSKVADFDPPHLHSAPPQGVIPVEFRGDLWQQKTRVPGLSCGVV